MPAAKPPSNLEDVVAIAAWNSMQMSSRMHKGLARNAKQAGDDALNRYHHGYEEGLLKAMKIIVEKFGKEE
jgi:hypothetical protein